MSTVLIEHPLERLEHAGHPLALTIPPDVRLRVSDEDFLRLCRNNPDLRLGAYRHRRTDRHGPRGDREWRTERQVDTATG